MSVPWWSFFARGAIGAVNPPGDATQRSGENEPAQGVQDWQREAWDYFEILGEIHYAGEFYARMLSGVRVIVEELKPGVPAENAKPGDAPPADEWQESGHEDANALLARLGNARGGLAQILADFGRLRFIQGEAQLVRCLVDPSEMPGGEIETGSDGNPFTERWEMLSAEELTYDKGSATYRRRRSSARGLSDDRIDETNPDDPLVGTMMAWRFYHRHPRYSGMADCSMRAVLSDCDELVKLKQAIRNTAKNRSAGAGILILPSAMGGNEVDTGDGKKVPANAKAIYDALTQPIKNEKAASAVTPVILFAPKDTTSQTAFHIDLRGAALYRETGLRDECVRRIAMGLDMPPEELSGMSNSNHWTAWQIDDAAWNRHGENVTRELVEQLTAALLAPLAVDLGIDPRRIRFWYDPTGVVQDPDRGKSAQEAHRMLIISDAKAREDMGYNEEDAPDDAEWERRSSLKQSVSNATAEGAPPAAQAATTPERIIGMADACVLRCRELAGSRLRTRMNSKGPANLRARIAGEQNVAVACSLGEDVRDSCDADVLVAGAGSVFLSGMIRLGLAPSQAERLVRCTEEHAARTLFDEEPGQLPDEVLALCAMVSRLA